MTRWVAGALLVLLVVAGPVAAGAADLPPSANDPAEVRDRAEDIVARSEYDLPECSVLQRALDWAAERLDRLLGGTGGGALVGWLVLALAVAATVWFLTRVGRTVQPGRRVGVEVEDVLRSSPTEWRAEAEALEADGAWKAALRCRYRALVGDLVAEGVLEDVAGRTTGEFRQEVAERAGDRSADFATATELFDLAWYADRPTGPEENARFRAAAERVTGVTTR